jgi:hypothetical protein
MDAPTWAQAPLRQEKLFHVDGHERAKQQFHQKEFSKECLLKLEPHCHRWLQVTKDETNKWVDDPDVNFDRQHVPCGHSCDDDCGWAMLEFHADINELNVEEALRQHECGGLGWPKR